MNCSQTQRKLIDYQSGKLDPTATVQVESHLSDCQLCQSFTQELDQFQALIQTERNPAINPFLTNIILEKVAQGPTPVYHIQSKLLPKLAKVAAIGLLIFVGVMGGLELGNRITSSLSSSQSVLPEITSLVNEMEHEPLEQMLLNLKDPSQ